jgi:hypothetical protein
VADYVGVAQSIVGRNKVVMLAVDVFFVDGNVFLITILRRIKFVMAEHMPVHTAKSLAKHLD